MFNGLNIVNKLSQYHHRENEYNVSKDKAKYLTKFV